MYLHLSCFGKKGAQRSRLKEALRANAPSLRIHPPHRHPAFKNVPIFERFHSTMLQVSSAESAENRDIFGGRWLTRREWGPGEVVLRAANQNRSIAGGNRSIIYAFARNASPRTISLVTFLFGSQESNICHRSDKFQFDFSVHKKAADFSAACCVIPLILPLRNRTRGDTG